MVWQIFILILTAAAIAAVVFYQHKASQAWEMELLYLTRHARRAHSDKTQSASAAPQSAPVVPNYRDARKTLKNKRAAVRRYEDAAAQKQERSSKKAAAAKADLRDLPIFADYPDDGADAETRSAPAPADENAAQEVCAVADNAAAPAQTVQDGTEETLPEVSAGSLPGSFDVDVQEKSLLAQPAEDLAEITLDDILRRRPQRRQAEQVEPKTISLEDIRSRQGWRTHPVVAPEIIGADKVRRRLKNIEVRDSAGKTEAVETISAEDIRAQLLRRRQARRQDADQKTAQAAALKVIGEEEVLRNLANIDSPVHRRLPRETVRESIIPPAARVGGAHTLSAQGLPEEPLFTRFTPYLHNTRKRNSADGIRKNRPDADTAPAQAQSRGSRSGADNAPLFPPAEGLLTGFKPLSAAAEIPAEQSSSAENRRAAREAQFADFFRQRERADNPVSTENTADGAADSSAENRRAAREAQFADFFRQRERADNPVSTGNTIDGEEYSSAENRRAAREAQFADFFRQRERTDNPVSTENTIDGTADSSAENRRAAREAQFADFFRQRERAENPVSTGNTIDGTADSSAENRRAAREAQFADFFRQRERTDNPVSTENNTDGTAIDFPAGMDLPPLDWTPPDAADFFADDPHSGQAEKKTLSDFPAINFDNEQPFAGLTLLPEENAADVLPQTGTAETPAALPFNVSGVFRQPEENTADISAVNAAETPAALPFNVSDLFRQPEKKKPAHFPHRLLPDLSLLNPPETDAAAVRQSEEDLIERGVTIEEKLAEFRVKVRVVDAYAGPVITRYEIEPDTGVRGNQVLNLEKDLARALGCASIRIVETIPGKTCMGLELPNPQRQTIRLSEILGAPVFAASKSKLTIALGQDITGQPVITDLARAPHLLVAGTTGSGKSVGVNAMILSMLFKATPEEVRLIMIDPKMLELSIYEGIPHLLAPVVTDMRLAANALTWCVNEMEKRYRLMSHLGVRNIAGYNQRVREAARRGDKLGNPFSLTPDNPEPLEILPAIVVVVDEFADLMMTAGKKIEELIARIAQKARAAGIHMILATQRPSVDVITGLIKANIPTRIAFQVASKVDSRTILDQMGAENLLGQGDMLFLPPGSGYPRRVHGAFVADDEVHRVVEHLKQFGEPDYIDDILTAGVGADDLFSNAVGGSGGGDDSDALYDEAVAFVLKTRKASISAVQRQFRIGYQRAARMIDQMENDGLISAPEHNGSRSILVPGGME